MTNKAGEQPTITQAKFWLRVDRRGDDECWPWLGGKGSGTANGNYGRFSVSHSKSRPAHQVSWEIANNKPFPAGKNGCHSCDNPWCVNPNHIFPGTQSENIKDCAEKGRHGSKPKKVCNRGHDMTGSNRKRLPHGFCCAECARLKSRERSRRYRARIKQMGVAS